MYGVLLVELPTGEQRVLKAFSGLLNGHGVVEGWVPPIPGRDQVALEEARTLADLDATKQDLITLKQLPERQQYETWQSEFEQQLQQMGDRHRTRKHQRHAERQMLCETLIGEALTAALEQLDEESRQDGIERRQLKRQQNEVLQPLKQLMEATDTRMRELKQRRKVLSRQLQTQMYAAYSLTNFSGQSLSLQQLMPGGLMPTGTGDCCAPKLLHYAATHNLKPLAMAEFWWGPSSADQDKVQGEFYGACAERCQPLMGFLLSGVSQRWGDGVVGRVLLDWSTICPHPQPFSLGRRELEFVFPLPGERARVRAFGIHLSIQQRRLGGWGEFPFSPLQSHHPASSAELPILYEDEWLIAVDKPAGLLSVPGRYRDRQDSVFSRLRYFLPDGMMLATVHRLDQETSGILLLARDRQTHRQLSLQFQQRQVHKVYEAVLSDLVTSEQGVIDLPLWADPEDRPYQKVDERGKLSLTHFRVMANYTRVEFMPLTGRTHQLRVHAADARGLGVPILGDRLYGCHAVVSRLHLHARELRFEHPQSGQILHLRAKTPF